MNQHVPAFLNERFFFFLFPFALRFGGEEVPFVREGWQENYGFFSPSLPYHLIDQPDMTMGTGKEKGGGGWKKKGRERMGEEEAGTMTSLYEDISALKKIQQPRIVRGQTR